MFIIMGVNVQRILNSTEKVYRFDSLCGIVDHPCNVSLLYVFGQRCRVSRVNYIPILPLHDERLVSDRVAGGWKNLHTILDLIFSSYRQIVAFDVEEIAEVAHPHEPVGEVSVTDLVGLN